MKKRVLFLLKCVIGIGLLAFVVSKMDFAELARLAKATRPEYVALAFLCLMCGQAIQSTRWKVILDASGFRVPILRLVAINLVGMFFNNFLPTSVGGDLFKAFYVAEVRSYGKVMSATLLNRFIGLMTALCFGLMAMPLASDVFHQQAWWRMCALVLTAIAATCAALLLPGVERRVVGVLRRLRLPERMVNFLDTLVEPLRAWRSEGRTIAITMGLSLVYMFVGFAFVGKFAALALNENLSLPDIAVIAAIASVAFALPITVNGLGVVEGAYIYLLSLLGVVPEKGLLLALLLRLLLAVHGLIGGVVYLFLKRSLEPQPDGPPQVFESPRRNIE